MKAGWEVTPLGKICKLQNGFAFKSKFFKETGMPVLRISSIQNDCVSDHRPVFTDPADYKEDLSKYEIHDGDLLIAMSGATTGKVGFNNTGKTFLLNQRVGKFEPSTELDKFYLYYFLSTKVADSLAISVGSAQPNLSTKQINNFQIPLPPLEEQQRIVAVLDEAFEGLARARAHAEANLQNARELFESLKAKAIADVTDYNTVELSEVAKIVSGQVDPRVEPYASMKHLGAGNMITGSDELIDVKTAREEKLKSGKYLFDQSVILYSKIRPYLRKAARPDFDGLCSADVYPIQPDREKLDRNYLFHLLLGDDFTKYAISGSDRAGMPKVNRKHMFAYSFDLPSIDAQRQIAREIDQVQVSCASISNALAAKLQDLDDLRQSLLQKAFAGELT